MEYDTDSMSGLMPQILALTAPPGSREAKSTNGNNNHKEGLAAHPYFKRPGRGHNHDYCDACGEGGDLICCDTCPASFHLCCHDPPLEEEDIPMGEWTCHQCRVCNFGIDKASGKTRNGKGSKKRVNDDERTCKDDKKVCAGGREFEVSDSPLSVLVKAAASVNPKQFTLPYELRLPSDFPGEPKVDSYNGKGASHRHSPRYKRPSLFRAHRGNGSRRGVTKRKPHEFDNGIVPLPAKICFLCSRSCRVGPLVPCDYCPLYFHLDCLDPPLTALPPDKWMCPNHPLHLMESYLLKSNSLCERVKLWDKFSGPVDQDAVKLSFFQKCHQKYPLFRYKVKRALRSRIRVPLSVKKMYKNPSELIVNSVCAFHHYKLPLAQEAVPLSSTLDIRETDPTTENQEDGSDNKLKDGTEISHEKPTQNEIDDWLSSLVCLQASILRHMTSQTEEMNDKAKEEDEDEVVPIEGGENENGLEMSRHTGKESLGEKEPIIHTLRKRSKKVKAASEIIEEMLATLKGTLKEKISNPDIGLNELEQSVIYILAWQRLQQLLEPKLEKENVEIIDQLQARALLCPLIPNYHLQEFSCLSSDSKREPVPMMYSVLTVGKGNSNDVDLFKFGHCNYISKKHAAILYDQYTGHYELINYAGYGTIVDNILYKCNFSEKAVVQAHPPPFLQQVREMLNERRSGKTDKPVNTYMTSCPNEKLIRCKCRVNKDENEKSLSDCGWEGTALLHHGSNIKFGCLQFVFSIVEEAYELDWMDTTIASYEKLYQKYEEESREEGKEEKKIEYSEENKANSNEEKNQGESEFFEVHCCD